MPNSPPDQRPVVTLRPSSYKPTKAELEDDVSVDATPAEVARAITRTVTVKVAAKDARGWVNGYIIPKIYVTRTPAGITPSCPLTEATVWVVLVAEAEAVSCPVLRVSAVTYALLRRHIVQL